MKEVGEFKCEIGMLLRFEERGHMQHKPCLPLIITLFVAVFSSLTVFPSVSASSDSNQTLNNASFESSATLIPAAFVVGDLKLDPSKVKVNVPVNITFDVKNIGDIEGTYEARLKVTDEIVETKSITLAGGTGETVEFTLVESRAGKYTVSIDDRAETLLVIEESASASTLDQPVLYERGPDWDDYLYPNGTHERKLYPGLMNYWNGSGYEPIDTLIVRSGDTFYVEKGAYKFYWTMGEGLRLEKDGEFLTYTSNYLSYPVANDIVTITGRDVLPTVEDNRILFQDVFDDIDVEYIYLKDWLKRNVILRSPPQLNASNDGALEFAGEMGFSSDLEVWADDEKQGGDFVTSGGIVFKKGDETVYYLMAPYVYDSNGSAISAEYELKRSGDKNILSVKVPISWLTNSSRVYPVVIDPSMTINPLADAYVYQIFWWANYGSSSYLFLNTLNGYIARDYLKFDLSDIPSGSTIDLARLYVYRYYGVDDRIIDVHSVSDDSWSEGGITWWNKPSYGSRLDYVYSDYGWNEWYITSQVRNEFSGDKKISLMLKDRYDGSWSTYRQWYYSKEGSYSPFLYVIYTPPPTQNDCNTGGDASNTFSGANTISTPTDCEGDIDSSDTKDWYKFCVNSGEIIDVSMTPPSSADFDLELYDPNGNWKKGSYRGTGSTDSVSYTADSSGYWRIKIYRYSGSGTYQMSVSITQPQNDCDTGGDASDTFSEANSISTPKSCTGFLDSSDRNDYYKFFVSSDYTIEANMTPPSGADFDLYLYDPYGNYKSSSTRGGSATDSVSYLADSSGEWHIRIYQYSGSGDYSFSVTVVERTPPSAPVISSSTHPDEDKWYNNNDPYFSWTTPYDPSGIAGYSYTIDHSSSTSPDESIDTTSNSKSYSNLADGIWYFHVKAKDNAGNWGPADHYRVKIDTTPPDNPTSVWSTSHSMGVWSSDNTIDMSWSGATDNLSGVYGYSHLWDTSTSTLPDTVVDTTGTSAISPPLDDGNNWYFHIRTKDNAGSWNSNAVHLGPFYIDSTAPPASSNIVWEDGPTSPDTTIVANWDDVTDTSSIVDYYLQVDVDSTDFTSGMIFDGFIESSASTKTLTGANGVEYGHTYYYRVKAKNGAGLIGGWSSISEGVSVIAPNQPPTAYIDSISPNPAIQGETVFFQGHGDDPDGYITTYYWRSSLDGPLSDQPFFSTLDLSPGTHTIYFKVQDDKGAWSEEVSDRINITCPALTGVQIDLKNNYDTDSILDFFRAVLSGSIVNPIYIDNEVNANLKGDVDFDKCVSYVKGEYYQENDPLKYVDTLPFDRITSDSYSDRVRFSISVLAMPISIIEGILKGYLWFIDLTPDVYLEDVSITDILNVEQTFHKHIRLLTATDAFLELNPMIVGAYSPVDISIVDPLGREIGAIYQNNTFMREVDKISGVGVYTGRSEKPEYILIANPIEGIYKVRVHGTDAGTYNLTIARISNKSLEFRYTFESISIAQNETRYHDIIIDYIPPEIEIFSPRPDSYLNKNYATVSWNASDNIGLNYYEVLLDNKSYSNTTHKNSTLFNLSDGPYMVEIKAFDLANNSASDFVNFIIDTTPPQINVNGIENGRYYNTNISAAIEIFDANLNSTITLLNDAPYASGTTITEEGDYVLEVYADDLAGNAAFANLTFVIDKTPPEVNISSPLDGSYVKGIVEITGAATDINLDAVSLNISGNEVASALPYSWDTLTYSDGAHVIELTARDKANNTATTSVTVYVDNAPPSITIASPLAQDYSYTQDITLDFNVSDDGSGVAWYSAYLNGSEVTSGQIIDLYNFALEEHDLTIEAADNLGNNATATVTFNVIDDIPPVVAIIEPEAGEYMSIEDITVNFTAYDEKSSIASVTADIDGSPVVNGETIDLASLSLGEHTLTVTALDNAGNTATESVTFILNPTPVEIRVTPVSKNVKEDNNFDFMVHVRSDYSLKSLSKASTATFAEGYTVLAVLGGEQLNIKVDVGTLESRDYSFTLTSIGGVKVTSNTVNVTVFMPGKKGEGKADNSTVKGKATSAKKKGKSEEKGKGKDKDKGETGSDSGDWDDDSGGDSGSGATGNQGRDKGKGNSGAKGNQGSGNQGNSNKGGQGQGNSDNAGGNQGQGNAGGGSEDQGSTDNSGNSGQGNTDDSGSGTDQGGDNSGSSSGSSNSGGQGQGNGGTSGEGDSNSGGSSGENEGSGSESLDSGIGSESGQGSGSDSGSNSAQGSNSGGGSGQDNGNQGNSGNAGRNEGGNSNSGGQSDESNSGSSVSESSNDGGSSEGGQGSEGSSGSSSNQGSEDSSNSGESSGSSGSGNTGGSGAGDSNPESSSGGGQGGSGGGESSGGNQGGGNSGNSGSGNSNSDGNSNSNGGGQGKGGNSGNSGNSGSSNGKGNK